MKNRWIWILALLALFGCGATEDGGTNDGVDDLGQVAQALTNNVTGNVKYENHWSTTYAGSSSFFRFANIVGTHKPLVGVQFCLRAPPAPERCANTDSNGNYSLVGVPTGTYNARIYWVSSDGRFKLTNGDAGGNAVWFSDNAIAVAISPSATVYNLDFGFTWTDSPSIASASTYAGIRAWFDTMANAHQLSTDTYFTGMGTILIKNSSVTSAGPTYVNTQLTALPTNNVVWHELGHTLEQNMHTQKWGANGVWPAFAPFYHTTMTNCLSPNGLTQESSETQITEGWADFIQEVVEFNTPATGGAGTNVCPSFGYCGVSNISTTNPTTMPACGAGSSGRSRGNVSRALMDLVDNEDVSPIGTCLHDTVTLTVKQVVQAMRDTNQTTAAQPYGNSQIDVDEANLTAFLYTVQQETGAHTYSIWADSCFQPGRSFGALLQ